jgi:5'-nucleotidase
LRARGLRTVLVTNAHQDPLTIKEAQTGLARYFDAIVSSHRFGVPKEHAQFWIALEAELRFDPARCVFIDDSLAVLKAARQHGIGQVFAITRPDSTQATRTVSEFVAIESVESLLGTLG